MGMNPANGGAFLTLCLTNKFIFMRLAEINPSEANIRLVRQLAEGEFERRRMASFSLAP